jgi:predicted lipid-binding transport protein (Tim44 family)
VSLALLVIGGLGLGVLAGLLALALGRSGTDASPIGKIIVVGLAFVVWKLRENMRPPVPNTSANAVMANDISQMSQPMTRNVYGQPIEAPTVPARTSAETDEAGNSVPVPTVADVTAPMRAPAAMPMGTAHPAIVPQRGTLLDRFLPALVLGALLFVLSQQGARWLAEPFSPSVAADNRGTTRNQPPASPALR